MDTYFEQFRENQQRQIPVVAHVGLDRISSMEEIKTTIFQMGPDKVPSPDGITAHFLQTYWDIMATDVTKAMQIVFQTCHTPTDWMRSRIALIPKCTDLISPKDFRPITVGNLMYRL